VRLRSHRPGVAEHGSCRRLLVCGLWLLAAAAGPTWANPGSAEQEAGGQQLAVQRGEAKYAAVKKALAQQGVEFSYQIYQVQAGDTVENIAARFGVRGAAIRQLNDLHGKAVTEGEAIAIPVSARPAPRVSYHLIEPRYAVVTRPSAITDQPGPPGAAGALYQPEIGSQLIVNAEQGEYFGVVMIDGTAGWIPKSCAQLTERTIPAEQLEEMIKGGRPDVVQEAMRYLGTPYRYGGRLPYNVDCSLLVQAAFGARDIRLPRTAAEQFGVGHPVHYRELLPGDRLYFVSRSGRINHTGIYIGDGRFVHASSRRDCVAIDALGDPTYWSRFVGARRS
jgi:LysM repeat protein